MVLYQSSLTSVDSIATKIHKLLAPREKTLSAEQKKPQAKRFEHKVNVVKEGQHL